MIYCIGQVLDRGLHIIDVHEGGMAIVYIVEEAETGKKLAAKTMREELLNDSSLIARFRREMKIWVGLGEHPHVVRAFFVKDIRSYPFIFMEYVDGGSLHELIKESHPLPFDQILRIARGIADGMRHVHNRITPDGIRGILHRDLKPANILVGKKGEVKVADFGLARALDTTLLTQTCDVVGTPHYASPEQIQDSRQVDERTDIYSFGAILYHLACGVPPFIAETWPELVKQIKNTMPPDPGELRENIPESLTRFIFKCLAKNRDDRFSNFGETCEGLSQLIQDVEGGNRLLDTKTANEIYTVLDIAEQEAAQSGSPSVNPVHILLALALIHMEPLSSWLREMRKDEAGFIAHIRTHVKNPDREDPVKDIKFKRSSRRVIGLAHTLAEQDGSASPRGSHIVKALLREPSVRDMMANFLNLPESEMEEVFDEIEGISDLSDLEER